MDPSVEIAIIGTITVICTGFFAWVQGFQAAARQRADWVRQDIVMKRAEETAVKAQETADLLSKHTTKVLTQTDAMLQSNLSIEAKVDAVQELAVTTHGLVNSALTEIKQDLLAGLIRELDMMVKLGSTTQEILLQEAKISDARTELADRTQTTIVMEEQRRAAIVEKERDIARRDPAAGG